MSSGRGSLCSISEDALLAQEILGESDGTTGSTAGGCFTSENAAQHSLKLEIIDLRDALARERQERTAAFDRQIAENGASLQRHVTLMQAVNASEENTFRQDRVEQLEGRVEALERAHAKDSTRDQGALVASSDLEDQLSDFERRLGHEAVSSLALESKLDQCRVQLKNLEYRVDGIVADAQDARTPDNVSSSTVEGLRLLQSGFGAFNAALDRLSSSVDMRLHHLESLTNFGQPSGSEGGGCSDKKLDAVMIRGAGPPVSQLLGTVTTPPDFRSLARPIAQGVSSEARVSGSAQPSLRKREFAPMTSAVIVETTAKINVANASLPTSAMCKPYGFASAPLGGSVRVPNHS